MEGCTSALEIFIFPPSGIDFNYKLIIIRANVSKCTLKAAPLFADQFGRKSSVQFSTFTNLIKSYYYVAANIIHVLFTARAKECFF